MKPKKNKDYFKKEASQELTVKKVTSQKYSYQKYSLNLFNFFSPNLQNTDTTEKNKKVKIIQFLNIVDNSLHQNCVVDVDEPMFQPEPQEILFHDYEPLQVLTKVLKLR